VVTEEIILIEKEIIKIKTAAAKPIKILIQKGSELLDFLICSFSGNKLTLSSINLQ
jgi:hypothetical protein